VERGHYGDVDREVRPLKLRVSLDIFRVRSRIRLLLRRR